MMYRATLVFIVSLIKYFDFPAVNMLRSITLLGVVLLAAVSAHPANLNTNAGPEDSASLVSWNEFLGSEELFDEAVSDIQLKSGSSSGAIIEQLKQLLGQDEILENVYTKYVAHYKDDADVSPLRMNIFKNQLLKIAAHNLEANSGKHSWWMGVNQFTDMTPAELSKVTAERVTLPANGTEGGYISTAGVSAPATLNYVKDGRANVAKNSHGGASSIIFAAVAVIETSYVVQNNYKLPWTMSEQQIVDCLEPFCKETRLCNKGQAEDIFTYAVYRGCVTWREYPYTLPPTKGTCKKVAPIMALDQNGPYTILKGNTDEQLKEVLFEKGPVLVALHFSADLLNTYNKGVYPGTECGSNPPNQYVAVVGYGNDGNGDYWLIKNNFGQKWGIQGFLKLARNGSNVCGILGPAYSVKMRI